MPKEKLETLLAEIRACRACVEQPSGKPLPHAPRPVVQASRKARIGVFGQAPGIRAHESGRPFTDASGDRLRDWLGVDSETFYESGLVAVFAMGFCFPGYSDKGADLPPRKECAPLWRARLMAAAPKFKTVVLVGGYAQGWHLKGGAKATLTETVRAWRDYAPEFFPVPHPSWRNNAWLKKNPWFETELLPALRAEIAAALGR